MGKTKTTVNSWILGINFLWLIDSALIGWWDYNSPLLYKWTALYIILTFVFAYMVVSDARKIIRG